MKTRPFAFAVAVAALLVGGSACSSSKSTSTPAGSNPSTSTSRPSNRSTVTVTGAWARMSPSGVSKGAVYLTLTSSVDDTLLTASVPTSTAKTTEIHETVVSSGGAPSMSSDPGNTMPSTTAPAMSTGSSMPSGSSMPGQMMMRKISSLPLPAGKSVALAPGGHHIMLIDLAKPLTVGSTVALTLTFEHAKPLHLDVPVKEG